LARRRDNPQADSETGRGTSLTLLERLRADEPDAWRAMVRLYSPLVYSWCGRSGVRGADADDVVQEVFQAAATHLAHFRRDREADTFRGWLRGITRNVVLMHFRRGARQPRAIGGADGLLQLHEATDPAARVNDDDDDARAEADELQRRALELVRGEFEERTWQMFWRATVEGRSPVDLAAELGVTPAAVRKAKSRVLHRLKEEFGELIQ
jgi:RNA polymerase sigma-70 factor, ECF subfamily